MDASKAAKTHANASSALTYRKQVELPTGSDYWFVHLGPVPGMPDWHQKMYEHSSYPFPSEKAANLFAKLHTEMYPGRDINVRRGE